MRLPSLLTFLLLLLSTTHTATAKETKLQRLTSLAVSSAKSGPGPIVLNDKTFEDITSGPRNYTAVVLLTALSPRFGCHLCQQFQPDFELLARSWLKAHKDSDALFWASLDFQAGKATFQKLGLTSAPILYLYPPTYGPNADPNKSDPIRYEFLPVADQTDPLITFITSHTPYHPVVIRPVDYTRPLLTIGAVTASLLTSYFILPYLLPFLTHPTLWAALSLISILLFTSGHMFNHIRRVPYLGHTKSGAPSYIAGGFQTQFGAESQIVGLVYAFLAFGTIALGMKIPRIPDRKRQGVAVVVWSGVVLALFSFLMALFKVKNGAYPFWLPPMMGRL
ncbi:hypothetical protein BDZ91DRAFT_844103 [Kalaharituber pfeilii]|nr:hypothetical protein BDZ91DRAFT_844103 [Kalaharituber pfeilii]